MDKAEAEEVEELSEWVVIQTSTNSPTTDASTLQYSPILQPNHRCENPQDDEGDDEEDSVFPVVGEEGESSISLPWRVIEIAKKRLIKDSVFFFQAVKSLLCNNVTRRRILWSLTVIGGFSLVSTLVYVKLVRWWRRLQEEKLRFLLLLVREKDQKIKELMVEIGRLNELLLSRRRVRVVRIV